MVAAPTGTAEPHMVAVPTGTAEPHMAAEPRQEGGAHTDPTLTGPTPSDRNQTNQKQDITKRVGEQK